MLVPQTSRQGRMDMYTIGENLAQSVIQLAHVGENCPVVLVGHCVGGLVIKALCLQAEQLAASIEKHNAIQRHPYQCFLRNLRGVFFYSVAHSGSPIFKRGESKGKGLLVGHWESLNSDASRINSDFANLRKHHGWKSAGVREANETDISAIKQWSNIFNAVVTEEASARMDIDAGFFSTISGEDYASICRPRDRMSMSFQRLENFLNIIRKEVEEEIAQRRCSLQQHVVLVDMAKRTADVIKMLKLEDEKTSWLGLQIVSMGGIGKSTLAKELLLNIGSFFEYAWFVEVGKQSLSSAIHEWSVCENLSHGSRRRVRVQSVEELWLLSKRSKVLVVLDDIQSDHEEEINLFLQPDSFGDGSRLIVTSRIQREMRGFVKYRVPFLCQESARELFQAHVSITVIRAMPTELVDEIVRKCDGLPLTVKVIGSYLCYENAQARWKGALNKLSEAESVDGDANDRLWKKLRVSYDDLGKPEQERFLDLASFDLPGSARGQYDVEVLKIAWISTCVGISEKVDLELKNLEDRSLIRIIRLVSWDTNRTIVDIHEQLRDMGKSISRPLGVPPRSCRGLWRQDDSKSLLSKRETVISNSNVEVLSVEMSRTIVSYPCSHTGEIVQVLPWDSLHELEKLRLLRMSNVRMTESTRTQRFPSGLTLLHMIHCSEGTPDRWSPLWWWKSEKWPIRDEDVEALHKLTVLLLDKCSCVRLPENMHRLENLKILRLDAPDLLRLPDKFCLPNLESLHLECAQLKKLPSSFLQLRSLKSLEIKGCSALKAWPISNPGANVPQEFCDLTSLTRLTLDGLSSLVRLPDSFGRLSSLEKLRIVNCSALKTLPEGVSKLKGLKELDIVSCAELESLCESFGNLDSLEKLSLCALDGLRMLPSSMESLRSLKSLELQMIPNLITLSASIFHIQTLTDLFINHCAGLNDLRQGRGEEDLAAFQASDLQIIRIYQCDSLRFLPESLGRCTALEILKVNSCSNLECLPESLGKLKALKYLHLQNCTRMERLPWSTGKLKSLDGLSIPSTRNMEVLPVTVSQLTALRKLDLYPSTGPSTGMTGTGYLDDVQQYAQLGKLKALTGLNIHSCAVVPESLFQLTGLERLSILGEMGDIPDSFQKLRSLHYLSINSCNIIPMSLGQLDSLRHLEITFRIDGNLPESLGHLRSLTKFNCVNVSGVPESLGQLCTLKSLKLKGGAVASSVPQSLGRLRSLTELECINTSRIPESLGQLSALVSLKCINVSGIPESLGQLMALRSLKLEGGAFAARVPQSLGHLQSLTALKCINMTGIPESLWQLSALKALILEGEAVPQSLGHLGSLQMLACKNMSGIPESFGELLPNLEELHILESKDVQRWFDVMLSGQIMEVTHLYFSKCENITSLSTFSSLMQVSISDCSSFERVPNNVANLTRLEIRNCPKFTRLPSSFEKFGYYTFDEDRQMHSWNKYRIPFKLPPFLRVYSV